MPAFLPFSLPPCLPACLPPRLPGGFKSSSDHKRSLVVSLVVLDCTTVANCTGLYIPSVGHVLSVYPGSLDHASKLNECSPNNAAPIHHARIEWFEQHDRGSSIITAIPTSQYLGVFGTGRTNLPTHIPCLHLCPNCMRCTVLERSCTMLS